MKKDCQESCKEDKDHDSLIRREEGSCRLECPKDEALKEKVTTDDSDSDVVLLSDDETDLCSPTTPSLTSMYSWQVDILNQTWEEWPAPARDIVVLLCEETGLSSDKIKDWYEKKTEQELQKLWAELQ